MKQFKTYVDFSFIVLLSLSAIISVRGGDVPKEGWSKPALTAPEGHELIGTVVDATQQFSQENLATLATSKSFEDFFRVLKGLLLRRPASNVTVTAKGGSVTKKTVTDSDGKFKFTGLPSEQCYEISAEMPSRFFGTGEERMARAKVPFEFQGNNWVRLELRNDLVIIKGRILDSKEQPIGGAKIRGIPCADLNRERLMKFPMRFAVSDSGGFYELKDLVPPDISDIAAYLKGRDPAWFSQDPFYVYVYVEADGYIQDEKNAPRVPLITEELLGPARRFEKIMTTLETLRDGNSKKKIERKPLPLPASQSNTITGIDIVLKKTGEGVK